MQIAQVVGNKITRLDHYTKVFPDTSFPQSGPDEAFLREHGCLPVKLTKSYGENQRLVESAPYIEDGVVYKVRVEDRSAEELASQALDLAKAQRNADLAQLTVSIFGQVFEANEQAQMRMSIALSGLYEDSVIQWVTADNQVASLTAAQLKELLNKAVEERANLWVKPYL